MFMLSITLNLVDNKYSVKRLAIFVKQNPALAFDPLIKLKTQ
jgi:hypothetical protein